MNYDKVNTLYDKPIEHYYNELIVEHGGYQLIGDNSDLN